MPCITEIFDPPARSERDHRNIKRLEAFLCGVLSTYTAKELKIVLARVDWNEVGCSRDELLVWWEEHQKKDRVRRRREREAQRINELKKTALNKLTAAERKALNL